MSTAVMAQVAKQVANQLGAQNQWIDKADLTQEAWVGMLKAMPSYVEGEGALRSFLLKAALRTCRRLLWRQGSAVHVPKDLAPRMNLTEFRSVAPAEMVLEFAAAADDVEAMLAEQERKERLAEVVAGFLAEGKEGEAARLVLLEGKAPREVGAELGMDARSITRTCQEVKRSIRNARGSRRAALMEVL